MTRHKPAAPAQNPANTFKTAGTKTEEHYIFLSRLLFNSTNLFRSNIGDLLQNLYPIQQQEGFQKTDYDLFYMHNSIIHRLVKITKYITKLREYKHVEYIQLEVGFLLQYILFNKLSRYYSRDVYPADIVIKTLYSKDWKTVSLKIQTVQYKKLRKQLNFGRRWSIAVKKLLYRVILLGGQHLNSIIYIQYSLSC